MYQLNLDTPETAQPSGNESAHPASTIEPTPAQIPAATKFYVVSLKKFYALFFGTLGVYVVYWFYRHWQAIKAFQHSDIWPIPRSIFLVFFTHNLFREIDQTLVNKAKNFKWPISPMPLATLLVIVTLISNGADRISRKSDNFTAWDFVSLILMPILAWGFAQAQKAANVAEDDPQGMRNHEMSTANYIWIALFGFLWVATLYSIYLYITIVS